MILDYKYNKKQGKFNISYIDENGDKKILTYEKSKFKAYKFSDNTGNFMNWDGKRCAEFYTPNPSRFDLMNFILELPDPTQKILNARTSPKLFTWDIEVEINRSEFPEPSEAKFPITSISVVNNELDCVVLGTKKLEPGSEEKIGMRIREYLMQSAFYREQGLSAGKFKYIYFESEREMLKFFLIRIVRNVAVLAGWNSDLFDWQYIHNRLKFYYPEIPLRSASITNTITNSAFNDRKNTSKIILGIPDHTVLIDYMSLIERFDIVLGIKESLGLDYIAKKAIGLGKIRYSGDLQHLFLTDYATYVFYNSIDSILIQLIDKRVKTLGSLYAQAQFCGTCIRNIQSKINITETMFFRYFFMHNYKVVTEDKKNLDANNRGDLIGAYVKQPVPGKYNFVCCNDFASLYPSVIQTCNFSIENYCGSIRDGDFTQQQLEEFRANPNYVVSINGSVYKNDKSYAFREIQQMLRKNRNSAKYLAKKLNASIMSDIHHYQENRQPLSKNYDSEEIKLLDSLGFPNIRCTTDLKKLESLDKLYQKLQSEIEWLVSFEQANKITMNSMYGGSSHIAFRWYNMNLANDITAEGRNLIHMMENHIPNHIQSEWIPKIAPYLGIKLKSHFMNQILCQSVYCDTDSDYLCYEGLLNSIENSEMMSAEEKRDILVRLNTEYLNEHNRKFIADYYAKRHCCSVHNFELETINYSGIWLDVKKKYAQVLLWKDGSVFDPDERPLKVKGLEIVKGSYPSLARQELKKIITFMLNTDTKNTKLIHKLNTAVQMAKQRWLRAPIEDVCENKNINGYTKYIISDTDSKGIQLKKGCPYAVRALANRNWAIHTHHYKDEPLYGGKMKVYITNKNAAHQYDYFAFAAGEYPEWASKLYPINKQECFQKYFLDSFNRILASIGMPTLSIDGAVQIDLFEGG